MVGLFKRFQTDRSGAITVDYIVLTGAVIALAVVTMGAVRQGSFEGIVDIVDTIKPGGCAVTSGSTTDLSACQ